jgi:peptidoglycan/xylan/chitin deacetylase (PgdA/CDA1 family)
MTTRVVIVASLLCVWVGIAVAQQPQNAPQQPGLRWTEDQITKVAHHVRAGRKLIPKSWPNGARVAVCISFDPDNFSIQLNRGDSNPVGISVGEYAPFTGIPRVMKLADKHGIPISWYIPAVAALLHPDMIATIRKRPRDEVAIHGWIHENPMTLNDPVEENRLITQSLDLLEKQWGRRPVGNRNPSWTMSPYTIDLLIKAGLLYDTSLQAMDAPHEVLLDGRATGLIELPVNWVVDDAPMIGPTSALPSPRLIFQTFKDDFDVAYAEGTLFMLTMHPHLSTQRSRIKYLEELILYMKSKPGVWFATGEEIARHIQKEFGLRTGTN